MTNPGMLLSLQDLAVDLVCRDAPPEDPVEAVLALIDGLLDRMDAMAADVARLAIETPTADSPAALSILAAAAAA